MSTNEGKADSDNSTVLSDNALPPPSVNNAENRAELIERARGFLSSTQIRYEGVAAKRHFLADKGLSDAEIADLIRETVGPHCVFLSGVSSKVDATGSVRPSTDIPSASSLQPACITCWLRSDYEMGCWRLIGSSHDLLCLFIYIIST